MTSEPIGEVLVRTASIPAASGSVAPYNCVILLSSGVIRSDEGASAVVNAIYLPVAFLAGSFWTAQSFPHFLEVISEILPLTHFIRLMRNIVLLHQPIWDNWEQVAVIAAWGLAGLILSARYFRWEPRES